MALLSRKFSHVDFVVWLVVAALAAVFIVGVYLFNFPMALIGVLIVTVCLVAFYYAFENPWLVLIPISIGSFLGAIFYFFENLPLPGTLFQFFLVIGLSIYLFHSLYYQKFEIKFSGLEFPLIIFLALIFLSLIYSPARTDGFYHAFRFIVLLVFVFYIINVVTNHKQPLVVLYALLGVGIVLASYAVAQYLLNPEIAILNLLAGGAKIERVTAEGLFEDPNLFAATLFLPISLTVAILFSNYGNKIRFGSLILFLVLGGGVVSSFSRSALISVGVIFIVTIIMTKKWKQAALYIVVLGLFLLMVPEVRSTIMITVERISEVLFGNSDDSSGIRMMLGKAAVFMFFDSYMLGVGFDGFADWFARYYTIQESLGVNKPHNITYTILAELGIFGFFIFIYLVWLIFRAAHDNVRIASQESEKVLYLSLLSAMYAYLIFYQFYGGGLTDNNVMLIIGFILAGRDIYNRKKEVGGESANQLN